MDRRTALALLAGGVVASRLEAAQHHLHALSSKPGEYKLQFFNPKEHELIDAVAEMIIPADAHSPGAHDAKVAYYIDLVATNSPAADQASWRSRVAAFDALAKEREGQPFLSLGAEQRARALNLVARNEAKPSTAAEHFFVDVKRMTVLGYYTSEIGLLKELEYKGNAALAEFPGCQHDPAVHK